MRVRSRELKQNEEQEQRGESGSSSRAPFHVGPRLGLDNLGLNQPIIRHHQTPQVEINCGINPTERDRGGERDRDRKRARESISI